jgi:Flp pilus assembly protein TadG
MRGAARRFLRARGGASAVEFALVIPPLFLLMAAVLEYGRLLWTREALQETAASAARCMGMTSSSCASGGAYSSANTTTYVKNVASTWGVPLTAANITLNNSTTCAGVSAPNGFSSVSLTYTFQTVMPHELLALSSGTALTTDACFPNNS